MDAVTEVLALRVRQAEGLERMLAASVVAHGAIAALILFAPAWWLGQRAAAPPENVMTISLGGAPGPRTGGMTTMGGRPVQEVAANKAVAPARPPAARTPEMIEPTKVAPRRIEKPVENPSKDARGRVPTSGAEVRKGSAVAETFGRGQGFGLSSGGGGTGSYLDTANFCCPEYLATMVDLIRQRWDHKQGASGSTVMKFTVERDGTLTTIHVEKSSGYAVLDMVADRAMRLTRRLPSLPAAFTEPSLTVHLVFEYERQ